MIFIKDYEHEFEETEIGNFEINDKYAIMWNDYSVYKLDITDMSGQIKDLGKLEKLKLFVDPLEKQQEILKVHVGSNPEQIQICVKQSCCSVCVIIWDMQKGIEKEAFDVGKNFKSFYD